MVESANRINMPAAVSRSGEELVHTIERNPLPSALTVFALGVGVGLVATVLLTLEHEEPEPWPRRYRRQALDAASHVPENVAHVAQQAARQALDGVMHLIRRN